MAKQKLDKLIEKSKDRYKKHKADNEPVKKQTPGNKLSINPSLPNFQFPEIEVPLRLTFNF